LGRRRRWILRWRSRLWIGGGSRGSCREDQRRAREPSRARTVCVRHAQFVVHRRCHLRGRTKKNARAR